ncbi:hypothetical protein COCCADRAFT_25023 [Bipolaris zeicola 26-R-13]|uniref:Uncharacterized protein n=1 Tax=Cochliobolus carbonum (strain 26-R-13) TaxID=930089 RepID=W6YBH3_COCC2|nr:uncharacterized protein COCCADRAFT_25023 [Bipolaris zeicola 26-R-13]EUC34910.1 hypothetical protein COCCADRAFT_25023 [Bipolaris zeicola 26-R-13]
MRWRGVERERVQSEWQLEVTPHAGHAEDALLHMQLTIPVEHGGDGNGGGGGSGVGGGMESDLFRVLRGCTCVQARPCQRSSPELQVAVVLAWRREHVMERVVCSSLLRCEAHRRDEHEGVDAGWPSVTLLVVSGHGGSTMGMVRTGVEISPSLSLVESQFTSDIDVGARYKSVDAASKTPIHPPAPSHAPIPVRTGPSIHLSIHPSIHTHQPSPPRFLNIDVSGTISALRAAPVSDPTDHPTPSKAFASALHSLP